METRIVAGELPFAKNVVAKITLLKQRRRSEVGKMFT